jgi:hypothetical protein
MNIKFVLVTVYLYAYSWGEGGTRGAGHSEYHYILLWVCLFTVLSLQQELHSPFPRRNPLSTYAGETMEVVTRNGEQKIGKKARKEQIESILKRK